MVDIKKVSYFIISMILLIMICLITINHLNNKVFVKGEIKKKIETKTFIDEKTKVEIIYELSDEISKEDIIKINSKKISKKEKKKNIIKSYVISLYNGEEKKVVNNTNIVVRIPIDKILKKYDDYKIVYINSDKEITDEIFVIKKTDKYVEFKTKHLSKYAVIGIKDNEKTKKS